RSIIITPADESEADQIMDRLNAGNSRPAVAYRPGQTGTTRPGLFFCDPQHDPELVGRAVAARSRGWLGQTQGFLKKNSGKVDPHRCRMCYSCMDICEAGAPQVINQVEDRHIWIDPAICTGCGVCAANCPSNAIRAGDISDRQLEVMIEDMLSLGRADRGE
ncbi:MAG: 4Fe-4S binding protein, partial [Desulfobacterales bacterium]|nr:4Fe-4S binding protein [Desulfobacterales bacterium]